MNFRKSRVRSRRNSTSVMVDSTEKWRTYNKRLSRRENEYFPSDDEDEDQPVAEVKDWAEEFFGRRSVGDESDQDIEVTLTRKQTLILSTLLPDEILLMDSYDVKEPRRFVGVLLMADVSGYTALSERYNNTGKGGTYRLTATLNAYLGSLIEIIYSHGGDIIKFAGDAFLALWKTDKRSYLCHTIHTVIACALVIQHSYAIYETDVKVNLRVKLAISAGNLMFSPIGTGIDMNYVIFGLPVLEAKLAESKCVSGEVKLAPSAWAHCYSRNYDHVLHEDSHVTIKSILYDCHDKDVNKPYLGFGALLRQVKKPFTTIPIEQLPNYLWESPKTLGPIESLRKAEALSLRKTILIAEERNNGSEIRRFMIRPVLTQVDAHQPLEYLTEMRQVSVVFVTFKPRECPPAQFVTIVNNSYQITCEIVYKSMGCVNKIILFDKDVMILVIFGLRGFKHESEAQAALKCGYSIRKSVSALDGVLFVSVGVTTGQVYCGVVGHPLRREFTVIGAIVNKAARLMCYFHNKITCDETTFVKSKMSKNGFTLQPAIELKGIGNAGKVYEYTEEIRVRELYDIAMIPPLLNRIDELAYLEGWLEDHNYRDFDALLLIGESRIGKSRLLEWMARLARSKGFNVCNISLTSIHSANAYLALSQIVNQMLEVAEPVIGFAKEEKILELLKVYNEDLCYLNNIIKVKFAYHEAIYNQDESTRIERAKAVFTRLIEALSHTYVFFFDDLQNLDAASWEFISLMFYSNKIFTVLAVTRGKFSAVHKWMYNVFINGNIRKIVLGPLSSEYIPALACQILDVEAVPLDLCGALKAKCKGMPGLVESFIVHLFSTGAIDIKKLSKEELEELGEEKLQFPDTELLKPQALVTSEQHALDQLLENDESEDVNVCVVTNKDELDTNINVQNLDAIIMVQIDSLTPYQQLLLKIASVIGDVLSRDLLENIMYENNPVTTAKAIKRLFAMRVLSCANTKGKWSRYRFSVAGSSVSSAAATPANLTCDCVFEYDSENEDHLPKYAFCKLMRFRNKNSRQTCYELLPINQKKEFHSRVVAYLENNKMTCPQCGGVIMVVLSPMNLHDSYFQQQLSRPSDSSKDSSHTSESENDEDLRRRYRDRKLSFFSKSLQDDKMSVKSEPSYTKMAPSTDVARSASYDTHNARISSSGPSPILKRKSIDPFDDSEDRRRSTKRVTMSSLMRRDQITEVIETSFVFDMLRPIVEAKSVADWHNAGIVDSQDDINDENRAKTSYSVKIEKGVSLTDFRKCTCADLKTAVYEQLIHHAKQAELKVKAIDFLIHYAYLMLQSDSIDVIIDSLDEAEQLCMERPNNEFGAPLTNFEFKRYLGKIYALKASAFLLNGNVSAAKLELDRASSIYRRYLSSIKDFFKFSKKIKIPNVSIKIKTSKHRKNEITMKTDSIFYLNVATLVYSTLGDERSARINALRAVELVQRVDCSVVDLCDAMSNALQVDIDRGYIEGTIETEKIIKHVFRNLPHPIQANELYAVGKLFMASFRARIGRAELPATIRSGFRALVVSNFLNADSISLDIIPDLFYLLLCRRRVEEAVDVLQLLLRLAQNAHSAVCEIWYFALCMDMILDGGFQVESPHEINKYAEHVMRAGKGGGAGRRRLIANLWTYWLRVDSERKAKKYESEALSWVSRKDEDTTMNSLLSALRLAEAMLESLARKVDDLRKVVDLMELRSIADRELTILEKECRIVRAIYPRWLLLKANSLMVSGRVNSTTVYNQAMEEARRNRNHLEEALARASLSNSRVWVLNARTNMFPNWSDGIQIATNTWNQLVYKMTTKRE